jgi:hypothetical protein
MPYTDHSRDPQAYARDVKELVLLHAAEAKRSNEPGDDIRPVVDYLNSNGRRPTAEHQETYEALLAKAQDILEQCDAVGGRPAALESALDELVRLAESLPGEVAVVQRPTDD